MATVLSFDFLAILNVFVLILWPGFGVYRTNERPYSNVGQIIMLILTTIVVVLDVLFLAVRLAHQ